MKKLSVVITIGLFTSMFGLVANAADTSLSAEVETDTLTSQEINAEVLAHLEEVLFPISSQVPITLITPSAMEGIYQVILTNEQILYINEDGSFFVEGNLYRITPDGFENMSEEAKAIARESFNDVRKSTLAALDQDSFIVFKAKNETKATITVFTDVDCAYCRKLHSQMAEYNALGIEVRYAAYPRAGVGSDSYDKMVSAWCAPDKNVAMNQLKRMQRVANASCDNPIKDHLQAVSKLGFSGTPSIVTADGALIAGYLPPEAMAERLGLL